MSTKQLGALLRDSALRWVDDGCYRLAASLAYYAVFSVFPLLLLLVTLFGFLLGGSEAIHTKVLESISSLSSHEFRSLLEQTLESMRTHQSARGVGALVGFVTLLFGASSVFSELQFTHNLIWRVKEPAVHGIWPTLRELIKAKAVSIALVGGVALILLASLLVDVAISAVSATGQRTLDVPIVWSFVAKGASLAFLTLVLAAIYRELPQTDVEWKDVFGAALLTASIFTALRGLLAWYLGNIGSYSAYGAVGAVLGFLTWIYLASLFLFFGAEFSRVYAERFGSLAPHRRRSATTHPELPSLLAASRERLHSTT